MVSGHSLFFYCFYQNVSIKYWNQNITVEVLLGNRARNRDKGKNINRNNNKNNNKRNNCNTVVYMAYISFINLH